MDEIYISYIFESSDLVADGNTFCRKSQKMYFSISTILIKRDFYCSLLKGMYNFCTLFLVSLPFMNYFFNSRPEFLKDGIFSVACEHFFLPLNFPLAFLPQGVDAMRFLQDKGI